MCKIRKSVIGLICFLFFPSISLVNAQTSGGKGGRGGDVYCDHCTIQNGMLQGGSGGAGGNAQIYSPTNYQTFYFIPCNQTSYNVYVSLSAVRENSYPQYIDEGWFRVVPGDCIKLGPYVRGTFLYYGNEGNGNTEWPGEYGICVPNRPFKEVLRADRTCGASEFHKFIEQSVNDNEFRVNFALHGGQ